MNKSRQNHIIIKDIGFSLLSEGKTLKIRADGYSMYPVIKPGSVIYIEPRSEELIPAPGEIIAWKRESGFVVHRLVKIVRNGSELSHITRGDSCLHEDLPVGREQIAGRVVRIEECNGKIKEGQKLIRKHSYFYNRLIVRYKLRIKRIGFLLIGSGTSESEN